MKKYFLGILIYFFCNNYSIAQQTYWQQQVNYQIKVSLNDTAKTLDGFETITYFNHSPDTLYYIWFHLWPNAYKNDRTAFAKQSLENGSTKFYFSNDDDRGYINQLNFKVNDITAFTEPHHLYEDVIKLLLPTPLAPHSTAIITTPFFVKLPKIFSRLGVNENSFSITQWYPKPAVYDAKGWHPMPYLDQGEFYSEFGNYDVQIILPENYMVAATGELQNKDVLQQLKTLGTQKSTQQSAYLTYEQKQKELKKSASKNTKTVTKKNTTSQLVALNFKQENCHDFAWFASKDFIVQYDTVVLPSKTVDVFNFYYPQQISNWQNSMLYSKRGIKNYSKWIGDYAYNTLSVVAGDENDFSGGMEYPTITIITSNSSDISLDEVIVHEIGHNWFYGVLANNERDHAWMDEGMNTYYQKRYINNNYQPKIKKSSNFYAEKSIVPTIINSFAKIKKDQPIDTISIAYSEINYFLSVYENGSLWMKELEKKLGTDAFDKAMQQYYQSWKFKHPYPNDFKQSIENTTGQNLTPLFNQLHSTTTINKFTNKRKIKPVFIGSLKNTEQYNYIGIAPIVGYNYYDKISIGAFIHNYQLPINNFQFFVAPMYAFGSKKLNYIAHTSYHVFNRKSWWQFSLNSMKFTMDNFKPTNAPTIQQQVIKFTPTVKLTLYKNDVRSTQRWIFNAKHINLTENGLLFKTVLGNDVVEKTTTHTYINRLSITSLDNRVLYPYEYNLTIDQGKNFVRAGFTANIFFNYKNRKGGINARFFAGKFFYTTDKTFTKQYETDRFHLNMSGAKGYEDYTYSNYFIGRNEFEGWQNQQIMQRDGFFKVRTDLLSNKIGKTDNWLMAFNFNGDIPDAINILSALPIKIPLKFFVDIGTYADAWNENPATGKFLYDAGLQLSFAKGLVNIYVPILYSKVYKDYFNSTLGNKKFWKNISFSIDIQQLQINKLDRRIPL